MKYVKSLLLIMFLFILSCTDGMQVSQKIDQLIKEKKITVVVVNDVKYKIEEVRLDNQFIEIKGNHFNLEKVRSLNVSEKELSITF